MDYLILGFMVSAYLKKKGFTGETEFERVKDVIDAYVEGYLGYVRDGESDCIDVSLLTKHNGELLVVLSKGELVNEGRS